jgi:hypothetical protein
VNYLAFNGFKTFTYVNIIDAESFGLSKWLTSNQLGLQGIWAEAWNQYTDYLKKAYIILIREEDALIWLGYPTGIISTKSLYDNIVSNMIVGN